MNAIELEIMRQRLEAACETMGIVLQRTALSANIKERRDFSCALFDPDGRLVAQAAHVPVHLGSMPESVAAAREAFADLAPGQAVMLNDPYAGGTHLPDITLVEPVYMGTERVGYVANRAHHADVGGSTPGSMTLSRHIDEEGVRFGPTPATEQSIACIISAMRNREERRGDLHAQATANRAGAAALRSIAGGNAAALLAGFAALIDYARRTTGAMLSSIPTGTCEAADRMDDDGTPDGPPVTIRLTLRVEKGGMTADFSRSDDQAAGCLNCPAAVTRSAVYYVIGCLLHGSGHRDIPFNAGCFEAVKVVTRPGSVVHAVHPAAVVAGNTEASQRIVDVVLAALRQALPELIPAQSCGTMSSLALGNDRWTYYETIGGGAGAGPVRAGQSGVQCHMTNTLNTPAEALELQYPLRIRRFALREGSGGAGTHRGGDGIVREMEILEKCEGTLLGDRRTFAPGNALAGRNTLNGAPVGGKVRLSLKPDDRLRLETPGGSGWSR